MGSQQDVMQTMASNGKKDRDEEKATPYCSNLLFPVINCILLAQPSQNLVLKHVKHTSLLRTLVKEVLTSSLLSPKEVCCIGGKKLEKRSRGAGLRGHQPA